MSFGFTDVLTPALCDCAKASVEDKSMTVDKSDAVDTFDTFDTFFMDPPKKLRVTVQHVALSVLSAFARRT
jgi:hypothetical protein